MTKLEEKLKELGYKKDIYYYKTICNKSKRLILTIAITIKKKKVEHYSILMITPFIYANSYHIEFYSQVKEEMQKDLEVLKAYGK